MCVGGVVVLVVIVIALGCIAYMLEAEQLCLNSSHVTNSRRNTYARLLKPADLARVGLDLEKGPSQYLDASHGHVCAFISLDGSPETFDIQAANIHSMPDLPKYDYDLSRMQV
jgi:hypothetical protein